MSQRRPIEVRFFEKVEFVDNWYDDGTTVTQCLRWTAALSKKTYGYGVFGIGDKKTELAHRWLYKRWFGPIPDDLPLDHDCHNVASDRCTSKLTCLHTRCVHPLHMIVSTPGDNTKRSSNNVYDRRLSWTHCRYGHEYTEANTIRLANGRDCRACARRRNAEYRERLRRKYGTYPRASKQYLADRGRPLSP